MSNVTMAEDVPDSTSPWAFSQMDTKFISFCLLFGVALLGYLAGSPYIIGWIIKLIFKRFILSKLLILDGYTFDIGTVSIAWLSGTIFAHKIEIRTQQFVILIVESRLSFFWWTNDVRSNSSFKELMNGNKPYRVQLKLVGVECILYANKSRFDKLRSIVEQQRLNQHQQQQESKHDVNINMQSSHPDDVIIGNEAEHKQHKSPSVQILKSSPYSKSVKNTLAANQTASKPHHEDMDDDDDEENEVSLGDVVGDTYAYNNDGKSKSSTKSNKTVKTVDRSTKQESVTMSVDMNENNNLLKGRGSGRAAPSGAHNQHGAASAASTENVIIRELKKYIDDIAPHWFFELCPVTRIGFEKVCIVVGNLNVEKYFVGSFKESEMLFYTEKNDLDLTIHPYKYSLIGKMWETKVRFTKNHDFRNDLQFLIKMQNQQRGNAKLRNKKIAEADYITDSIYLVDKLLSTRSSLMTRGGGANDDTHSFVGSMRKHKKKDKNVQIGPLTQESLQINRDEYGNNMDVMPPTNLFMLDEYKAKMMRNVGEHSVMSPGSSKDGDSSHKRVHKKHANSSKHKDKNSKSNKSTKSKSSKLKLRVFGGGGGGSGPSEKSKASAKSSKKTGASKSSKTTRTNPQSEGADGGYTYNTVPQRAGSAKTGASSVTTNDDNKTFITHSSHYTHSSQRSHQPYTYYNPRERHRRQAGTHNQDNTCSHSGEIYGSEHESKVEIVEHAQGKKQHRLTVKVAAFADTHSNSNQSQNSPYNASNATPPTVFIPRFQSEASQATIIVENMANSEAESKVSGDTGPIQNTLHPPSRKTLTSINDGSGQGSTIDIPPMDSQPDQQTVTVDEEEEENKYGEAEPEPDPDSTEIIHIDSFSFFFQRDSPAQLTDDHLHMNMQNIYVAGAPRGGIIDARLNEDILPQQKLEMVVHNECMINYGPYADDLRTKLMSSFLPFMYQHREPTPLIPSMVGDYFEFASLQIVIKFEEPKFPPDNNFDSYSDTASTINSANGSKHERLKSPHFASHHDPNDIPWFILNIPFSANLDEEAKQLDEEVIDNHLMQIKFGANSLIKISIPWTPVDLGKDKDKEKEKCDYTTIDVSLTPCNISSSIRKSELYHSIIDTDKFIMKYKWTTPLKWNGLQRHEIDMFLEKIDKISSVYFLSEHINVFKSISTDWMSYRPEVTIEYFVPSVTTIKLHAKETEIITSVNEFNVIHIGDSIHTQFSTFTFLDEVPIPREFLDYPTNARLKWKGIIDMELSLPATDWKPSVSTMKLLLEMKIAELYLELPSEHPFTDMMYHKKARSKHMYDNDDWCQCLKFKKAKFEINFIYHNVYYREHRDSMNISLELIDPEFKVYGHFIRYLWNFIENYSATFSEFLTMEEFRSDYYYSNTTSLDKRKKMANMLQESGAKINAFECYTQISICNASLILPSSIVGSMDNTNYQQKMYNKKTLNSRIKFQHLMFDFRSTDEYSNMYIHSSPIRCMIPLTEQEQSSLKSALNSSSSAPSVGVGSTFLSIDSFTLQRQAWNGIPPQFLTYSQTINADVGKIKMQLFDCQLQRLVHSINSFVQQYNQSFDARCFDFREKEHILLSPAFYTNDNADEIDYPSKELAIMNVNLDIKSIEVSIHHNVNVYRYQHITRCTMPYGIQIRSTSESTLEFAQRTVIECNRIELQHLISTTKPTVMRDSPEEKKFDASDASNKYSRRARSQRGKMSGNRSGANRKGSTPNSKKPNAPRRRSTKSRKKYEKMNKNKVKDDLLCVGSLDSHFQIILTTERSDQEMYHSKQRNFENRQLQQTEDDVEMEQDWPFHLLNTIYMQEPLPKQRSPNRNPKMPVYQQTELEYELYGKHNEYVSVQKQQRKKKIKKHQQQQQHRNEPNKLNFNTYFKSKQHTEVDTEEANTVKHKDESPKLSPQNPFISDDGDLDDSQDEHKQDESPMSEVMLKRDKYADDRPAAHTADEDTDKESWDSPEEFQKSSKPTARQQTPTHPHDESNRSLHQTKSAVLKAHNSYLTTPSPDNASAKNAAQQPPAIVTVDAEDSQQDDEEHKVEAKQFHVSNYMAKYRRYRGPSELGSGWKKPRHLFHVNADYVPLPETTYKIATPSLLRKYMNNSNIITPRPGAADFGWGLQISPRIAKNIHLAKQQQTLQEMKNNNNNEDEADKQSTLHVTYRTHVNIADNTSIVITPEFLDSVHVYMRLLQPKSHSLSEVLDEMQQFVGAFYDGTYSPHYDGPAISNQRIQQRHHQDGTNFDQFKQKKIISAIIGTIHVQSLERAEKAPGIFLLDARISHISIEHCKSYKPTPWKTVLGDIQTQDTLIHFANASFQGFKASPSVDGSNGMPPEIKEWGHVLDPSLLFETTENTEYFIGIEMSDSCVRRTQYMHRDSKPESSSQHNSSSGNIQIQGIDEEEEVKVGGNGSGNVSVEEDYIIPTENLINLQHVKVSTSATAFGNIATLIHRSRRYTTKISQELPWQNALKMDRFKFMVGEMLTSVSTLQSIKSRPWHRHFLEWLQLRTKANDRKKEIKNAFWGWNELQKQSATRNNYTRASGIVFMVIVRNLIGNIAPRVERKLNDGFLNVAQQYLDPQYIYSHRNRPHPANENAAGHSAHRYSNAPGNAKMDAQQHIGRKRYLFAAQKEQFYSRKVEEFAGNKKIADPIIRQCFIELTKELSEMFFPKQQTNHLKYKESIRWNVVKSSFEVIQDQEKSFTMDGSLFRGFLKIASTPPQRVMHEKGIYTVTISTTLKKVALESKPAALDALFSLNRALTDLSKQNQSILNDALQQQYYYAQQPMYRFGGSFGYEPYLIPPSGHNANLNAHKSSTNSSDVRSRSRNLFRALRSYSKPSTANSGMDKSKFVDFNKDGNYYSYAPYSAMNMQSSPQSWVTKINSHLKIGEIRATISTPECADLDIQIIKLSFVSNRSILPPIANANNPFLNHSHHHSQHSSGSSSFSGFRDEYHNILVNIWKMDARLLLGVELDDVSSGLFV